MSEVVALAGRMGADALELAGITLIVAAVLRATIATLWRLVRRADGREVYQSYRQQLARGILLGLEFLVAADIIHTVAVELTFRNVGILAVIVLIRTFLSVTLEVETTGRWPWQKQT